MRERPQREKEGDSLCPRDSVEVVAEDVEPRYAGAVVAAPFGGRDVARADPVESNPGEKLRRPLLGGAGEDVAQGPLARLIQYLLDQLDRDAFAGKTGQRVERGKLAGALAMVRLRGQRADPRPGVRARLGG